MCEMNAGELAATLQDKSARKEIQKDEADEAKTLVLSKRIRA